MDHHKARCLSTLCARQRYLRLTVGGGRGIIVQGDNCADTRATVGTKDELLRCGRGPNTSLPCRHVSGQRDGRTEVGGSGEGLGPGGKLGLGGRVSNYRTASRDRSRIHQRLGPRGVPGLPPSCLGRSALASGTRPWRSPPIGSSASLISLPKLQGAAQLISMKRTTPSLLLAARCYLLRCCAAVAFLACLFPSLSPLPDILSFNHPHPRAFPSFTRPASLSISRFTLVVAHYSPRSLRTSS